MLPIQNFFLKTIPALPIEKFLSAAGVLIVGYIAIKYIMKLARAAIAKLPLDVTLHEFLIACVRLVLYFLVIMLCCGMLGIEISSLLTLFGVVGLAISLSVQNLLTNMVSGLILLISKPFSVGDFIESGNISGHVNSISLLHTRINTSSNKAMFVPNAKLTSAEVTNHDLFPTRRVDLNFTPPETMTMSEVMDMTKRAAHSVDAVLAKPEPFVSVSAILTGRTDYTLRVWTDSDRYWDVHFALLDAVKKELESKQYQGV